VTTALAILAWTILLALGVLAYRYPVVRNMVVRNVLRRKVDSILVVVGCALGAAIITTSLLVGDSLEASLRERAVERLGPIDVAVSSYSPMVGEAVQTTLTYDHVAGSDGTLGALAAEATLATPVSSGESKVVTSARLLEVDFQEAASFGSDPAATGVTGSTPGLEEVVLAEDAAEALSVGPGDEVEVYAYGQSQRMEVVRVLRRVGIAGYASEFETESVNAFVAPGTIAGMAFRPGSPLNARPPEYLLFISGMGGVFGGAENTGMIVDEIATRLGAFTGYEIAPVKSDLLRTAAEDRADFAELFLSLGSFAMLAGAALLINMLVMLSEERRRELGILRAMGLSRRLLFLALLLEGALCAVVASALGVAAGVGVARLIMVLAGDVFSSARHGGLSVQFGVDPTSLLAGFLAGLIISLLVVAAAGVWVGRMTIVEAIRNSARQRARGTSAWVVVAVWLGAAALCVASTVAVSTSNDLGSLLFPVLALICLAAAVARRSDRLTPRRRTLREIALSGMVIAAMLWVVLAFPLLELNVDDVTLFVVQGVVLTLGAVVLAGRYQRRIAGFLGRLGGRGLVPRLALSYPSSRRFRMATTLTAYSLIVFTLVFSSVLSGLFSSQARELVADEGGGYDLLVETSSADPLPTREFEFVEGVEDTATLNWTVADFRVEGSGRFRDWAVSGLDWEFVDGGAPALEEFDRRQFSDEEEVWKAVLKDPTLVIADVAFLESGGGPPENNVAVGDRIEVRSPVTGKTVDRRVIAVSAAGAAFSGVMLSKDSLAEFVENPVGNRHYLQVSEGSNPEAVAEELQRDFLTRGLEARTFDQIVQEALRSQEQFFDLIEGYLVLGLFMGITSLGVVMMRAVRERRHQIGVLRALGFSPAAVRAAFLLESGLVAIEGVLIGAALALATSYQLVAGSTAFGGTEVSFTAPWTQLILLTVAVLTFSLSVALPSAFRVASMTPAATLRAAEEGST
jgi:putative ABC transport system permease protein